MLNKTCEFKYEFEFPEFQVDHQFTDGQLEAMEIKPHPLISDWLEENISLCGGYLDHGPFRLKPWQKQVVNSPYYYDFCCWLGPTRTGKSMMSESVAYYCMGEMKVNGILAYPEATTAEHRFSEVVKPMIEGNKPLRDQWNGDDKQLTVKRIRLNQCTWRVASAQNKNDIASFSAPVGIGSEVGKWEKTKKFNAVQLLKGRQGDSHDKGFQKILLETTPFEVGDMMYIEVYNPDTLILHPFYPCPHCNEWHKYTDRQIKVRDDKFKTAGMIRRFKQEAVYYECPHCKQEVTEKDRASVDHLVVWAAPEIHREDFHQEAEKINSDGSIDGVLENGYRPWVTRICYQWPRGVDINYQWWKWLADYFEAKDDPVKLKSYQNEVNANYFTPKTGGVNVAYLESKKGGYLHRGQKIIIPDDVLISTLGIDTQDNGFYYLYLGWCFGLIFKILKHGFIHCDIKESQFKENPANVYSRFNSEIYSEQMYWSNNIEVNYSYAFIDRGGHRSADVNHICNKMGKMSAYVGLTKVDYTKDLFYESDNGPFYLGQTEQISELTGNIIDSNDFYIPDDFHPELCRQLARQWFMKRVNSNGNPVSIWMHGGEDHFRDCLNLAYIAGRKLNLHKLMIDQTACNTLYNSRNQIAKPARPIQQEQQQHIHRPQNRYDRVYGRRY